MKKFELEDSFHSIVSSVTNLISLFYGIHTSVNNSFLEEPYKSELLELVGYVYYSKINFLIEHFEQNDPNGSILKEERLLKEFYSKKIKN